MNRHLWGNSQSTGHSTAEADSGYIDFFRGEIVGLKWGVWRVASCDYLCTVLAEMLVSWQRGLPAISAQAVLNWELLAEGIHWSAEWPQKLLACGTWVWWAAASPSFCPFLRVPSTITHKVLLSHENFTVLHHKTVNKLWLRTTKISNIKILESKESLKKIYLDQQPGVFCALLNSLWYGCTQQDAVHRLQPRKTGLCTSMRKALKMTLALWPSEARNCHHGRNNAIKKN